MALTSEEIKQLVVNFVTTNPPGWTWEDWNVETGSIGLWHKFDAQLVELQDMYTRKAKRLYQHYKEMRFTIGATISPEFINIFPEGDAASLKELKDKVLRIAKKWRAVNAEIEGRSRGFFGPGLTYDREYHGTDYFIDLDGGNDGGRVYLKNCSHNNSFLVQGWGQLYSEDDDGVLGSHIMRGWNGTITKDTGVTRVGGADSSAKMEPSTLCALHTPLEFADLELGQDGLKVWCAAALTTITVYIRSLGTWGAYPTADELYLEAFYISDAGGGGERTRAASNDVLSHASDWKAFDVTFTPTQAGFVYLNVAMKLYEDAGDGCYVDIKPVVS